MSVTLSVTLDDETAAYLERLASDQGRTAAEVAAWIVREDLRRERSIDAALVAHLDTAPMDHAVSHRSPSLQAETEDRERAGA